VTSEWQPHELGGGSLLDPVLGPVRGGYGVGMTGQAMVELGQARGSEALIDAGLRAESSEVRHPDRGGFELLDLSEAYAWNEAHLADQPAWRAARGALASFLVAHGRVISFAGPCFTAVNCYDNLKLVAALADLELLSTGLRGESRGALLSHPVQLRREALAALAFAARNAGSDARRTSAGGSGDYGDAGLLSDPLANPLAYHALSTMMLGRVVRALGPSAPRGLADAFSRMARALVGLMAPDGDVAYIGRGQGQVWTVAASLDALCIAAAQSPSPVWRGRFLAGAALAAQRLRAVYPVAGWGFPLVPRLALESAAEAPNYLGIDGYANTVQYNGLALWALSDAARTLAHVPGGSAQPVPSQTDGVFLDPLQARFATVTRGGLWFAVHGTDSNTGDARYGFGLIAAEMRTPSGWMPALPPRPLTSAPTAGGLAMRDGGRLLYPIGSSMTASPGGEVAVRGGWGPRRPQLDPGTVWTFRPTPRGDGVSLSFQARAGRRYQFQLWFAATATVSVTRAGVTVTEPDQSVQHYSPNARFTLQVARTYHSAYAESLHSLLISVPASAHAHTLICTTTVRAPGAPAGKAGTGTGGPGLAGGPAG
jgi:hypothetical protein